MELIELVQSAEFDRGFVRLLKLLKTYFRVEIEGLENLPAPGKRGIICPNHSGYAGTDAVLLAHLIRERSGRRPRILAHRAFFDFSSAVRQVSEKMGLQKATIDNGVNVLKRNHLLILFPEGEKGNFKPTLMRYRLQKFHTGFLRIAMQAGAPIIPCVIIGAEESHINLGNIDLGKLAKGLRIPLPLTLMPLPAKWKIRFMPPIATMGLDPALLDNPEELKLMAHKIRRQLQHAIHEGLRSREFVYSKETRTIAEKLEGLLEKAQARAKEAKLAGRRSLMRVRRRKSIKKKSREKG